MKLDFAQILVGIESYGLPRARMHGNQTQKYLSYANS